MQQWSDCDVEISRVILAHHDVCRSTMTLYRQGRKLYGIVAPIEGTAEYEFMDGERICLQPGDVAFLPALSAYCLNVQEGKPLDHYTVNFLCDEKTLPERLTQGNIFVLRPDNPTAYQARLGAMAGMWKSMHAGYRMRVKAALIELMADFIHDGMKAAGGMDVVQFNRTLPARQMMEARYAEALTQAELARACQLSVSGFRRAFAEVYRQPPSNYLMNLRIEKAREFLLLGHPLTEVAAMTGFADVNYFIRVFRKCTGLPPGKYRKTF